MNYFTGILNIGKNGNQKTLYDINNIKKTTQNGKLDNSSVILNKSSFSKNNIPQANKNVKSDIPTNYSMQNQQNNPKRSFIEKIGNKIYNKFGGESNETFEEFNEKNQNQNIEIYDSNNRNRLKKLDSSFYLK